MIAALNAVTIPGNLVLRNRIIAEIIGMLIGALSALKNSTPKLGERTKMLKMRLPNGDVKVQAWICSKEGHPGMIVYTQEIAVNKLAEGFNIEIVAITRHQDGKSTFEPGVVL